jgi:hypothetical protein
MPLCGSRQPACPWPHGINTIDPLIPVGRGGETPRHIAKTLFGLGVDPPRGSWLPLGGEMKNVWEKATAGLAALRSPGAGRAKPLSRYGHRIPSHFANSKRFPSAPALRNNGLVAPSLSLPG